MPVAFMNSLAGHASGPLKMVEDLVGLAALAGALRSLRAFRRFLAMGGLLGGLPLREQNLLNILLRSSATLPIWYSCWEALHVKTWDTVLASAPVGDALPARIPQAYKQIHELPRLSR
jgi:hypothetical protein